MKRTAILAVMMALIPVFTWAHCDTMDGPVIQAAIKALDTNNINLVLIWVKPEDEATVKAAFEKTMAIRNLKKEVKEIADIYFFETLVRIHRTGEGAPYTGIKPHGTAMEPSVLLSDKAISSGNIDPLIQELTTEIKNKIKEKFKKTVTLKNHQSVKDGREFVENYVQFTHYIEAIFEAVEKAESGHSLEHKMEHHE